MRVFARLGKARGRSRLGLALLAGLVVASWGDPAMGADDSVRLPDYFGFLPVEVYKLDNRITGVLTRDLDGDKAEDIVIINNARSRIDLLLTGKRPDGEPEEHKTRDINGGPERPADAAGEPAGQQAGRQPPGR